MVGAIVRMLKALERICQRFKHRGNPPRRAAVIAIDLAIDRTGHRTRWGTLEIQNPQRHRLLGPVEIQTYGNIPMIDYEVMGIRVSGPGTLYPTETYGPEGIVLLEGNDLSRTIYLTIQGGNGLRGLDLLATNAGIRVPNPVMQAIVIALETIEGPIDCRFTQYCSEQGISESENNYETQTETEEISVFESLEENPEDELWIDESSTEERLDTDWMNDDGYA
jgi:hypothetical protein